MLPEPIIVSLINGVKPKAEEFRCASVLFCEVHKFSQIWSNMVSYIFDLQIVAGVARTFY